MPTSSSPFSNSSSSGLLWSLGPRPLHALMRADEPLHVLDVRRSEAFASDPIIIAGAQRLVPWVIPAHLGELRAKNWLRHRLVMVCVYGHAVSQTTAAIARCHGFNAFYLEGGIAGWRERGLPLVPNQEAASRMSAWRVSAMNEEKQP